MLNVSVAELHSQSVPHGSFASVATEHRPPSELLVEMAKQHTDALLRWVGGKCQDRAEAWDLVQGTFEKALRARPHVVTHKDLRAWLMVVARNLYLDRCRAPERRQRSIREIEAMAAPEAQELAIWRRIDLEIVYSQLPHLTPQAREVFELRVSGASMAAIAAHLRIPMATVYTRLHRARRQLRSLLVPDGSDVDSGVRRRRRRRHRRRR